MANEPFLLFWKSPDPLKRLISDQVKVKLFNKRARSPTIFVSIVNEQEYPFLRMSL